jgi:hypothetical protein
MSDGQDQQRYSAGQRVTLGIELHDDSGIYDVTGLFVHSDNPNAVITLPGYGRGAQHATVYIQNVVTTNTLPGQYVCKYIQAQDGRGNRSTLHPDITFYVDQQHTPVDDQGPQLEGWGFPSEDIQFAEVSMIEVAKEDERLHTERQLELTAKGTSEGTGAQGNIQEGSMPDTPEDMQGSVQETDALQLIEGKMNEMAADITEDTGGHGDIYLHTQRRMDEMAKEMTEDTGGHGDIHLHAQRKMDEMAKEMFEED